MVCLLSPFDFSRWVGTQLDGYLMVDGSSLLLLALILD